MLIKGIFDAIVNRKQYLWTLLCNEYNRKLIYKFQGKKNILFFTVSEKKLKPPLIWAMIKKGGSNWKFKN